MLQNLLFNPEKIRNKNDDNSNLNNWDPETGILVDQVWCEFFWILIFDDPISILHLLRKYFHVGQYDKKLFVELENAALRRIARNNFERSLRNAQIVVLDLKFTKFKIAKFKPFRIRGSLANYSNENAYLHNPNSKLFDHMILRTVEMARTEAGLFFDIGAHTGLYSMLACGAGFEVISVEAHPDISKVIKINKKLNDFRNIKVINKAIGKMRGKVVLEGLDPRPGSRVFGYTKNSHLTIQPVIEQVTLNDLYDEFGCPAIIKIDIEGLEIAALKGAKKIIEKGITTFLIDIHQNYLSSMNVSPQIFLEIFPREKWCFSTLSEDKEVLISTEDVLKYSFVKISPIRQSILR